MRALSIVAKIALIAAVVGAVNWLLIGIFQYNFIAALYGSGTQTVTSTGARVIYIIFGAGGIIALPLLAAGMRRRVAVHSERSIGAEEATQREARGPEDYREYRDYQAWKAEKARVEAERADAEAAQAQEKEHRAA